jgi:hypothetical protein
MAMRLLSAGFALLLLAGCATGRSDGSERIQTTAQANNENMTGAMQAPLRDVNVLRTKIPDILLQAIADPYARPPQPSDCPLLVALIQPLEDALGPDLDAPAPDEDDLMQRGQTTAIGAVAGLASDVIPFRGWVRKLSGAERHDALVQSAIVAGAVRRAYLKGLGEARGCNPPATPSHVHAGRAAVEDQSLLRDAGRRLKPNFPIRQAAPEPASGTPQTAPGR